MKDKVVIVTGGTSGIGEALAREFGLAGSKIVITGRNPEKLTDTEKALRAEGIDILAVQADVSQEEHNKKMVEQTLDRFGKIDILINNAGISMRALFEDLHLDVFRQVMDINFYGTVYATKYCLSEIMKNKGSIIGISSIVGYRGTPARTAYSASKYAMQGFFEVLRTEVMKRGVHVLVACPGFTGSNIRKTALTADGTPQGDTPQPEDKLMTAGEVAQAILKATKKRKRDLILTTQGKTVVFLNKWFPKMMDKIVYNHMAKEPNSPFK
ncbi:MAG: SDR family oxidoreductase [Candidatus Cyclobacteriaceae bacterium M3_2C_046]